MHSALPTDTNSSTPIGKRFESWALLTSAFLILSIAIEANPLLHSATWQLVTAALAGAWILRALFVTKSGAPLALAATAALALAQLHVDSPLPTLVVAALLSTALAHLVDRTPNRSHARLVTHSVALVLLYQLARVTSSSVVEAEGALATWLLESSGVATSLSLGPSALGVPIMVLAACFLASRFLLLEMRPVRMLVGLLGILGLTALTAILFDRQDAPSHATILRLPACLTAALIVAAPLLSIRLTAPTLPAARTSRQWKLAGLGALLVLGLCTTLYTSQIRTPRTQARVGLCSLNEGRLLNWDVPHFGDFGPNSIGFAGLLPRELRAHGFDVVELRERPSTALLAGLDVYVTVNVDAQWSVEELQAIWTWVHEGGQLLVLGDHTDVAGTRQSQNDLLLPFGIEFNYDAAVPPPGIGWMGSFGLMQGPLGHLTAGEYGLGVGASLRLSGEARSLAKGGFLLADLGNGLREDKAFLGNYALERGERVGDVDVIADARFGAGGVLVFADTGAFQNGSNMMRSESVVVPVFRWLTAPMALDLGSKRWGLELAALIGLIAFVVVTRGTPRVSLLVPLAVALIAWRAGEVQTDRLVPQRSELPVAWIDFGHGPRVDYGEQADNDVMGILKQLGRAGFAVRRWDGGGFDLLRPDDMFLTIAPVQEFTDREVETLTGFAESGGLIVTAAGFHEQDGLLPLLDAFGIRTGDNLVGPIPFHRYDSERVPLSVEYVEAWELDLSSAERQDITVYGGYHGMVLAAHARRGSGGLFHVGDTRFFSSPNFEQGAFVSLPNIGLLRRLLAYRDLTGAPQ